MTFLHLHEQNLSKIQNLCQMDEMLETYLNFIDIEVYLQVFCSRTDRQSDNPIFHKVETYLERLFVPKIYIIPNFVKILRAALENVNYT